MTQFDIDEQYSNVGNTNTVGPVGVTRVMSPNETSYAGMDLVPLRQSINPSNHHVLMGCTDLCSRCRLSVTEPSICASCGDYGHPVCLGLEHFQDYSFCSVCMRDVTAQYGVITGSINRQQWHSSLHQQLTAWKSRATGAMGMSASIGVTLGLSLIHISEPTRPY